MKRPSPIFLVALISVAIVAGLAAAYGLLVLVQTLQPHEYQATLFEVPLPAEDFSLRAATGEETTLADFEGQLVLMYFGYTSCPDFCPDTLNRLAAARELLGRNAEQVQVVMVTVDPERDTPEKLVEYMAFFDPSFMALTGSLSEIEAVAARYGIFIAKTQVGSSAGYLVDHTVSTQILNANGERIGVLSYGLAPEDIAADLRALLSEN